MFLSVSKRTAINEIISYTYPKLYMGKEWYIGFHAFDPVTGKMKRKKIKLNHIGKVTERKKSAGRIIAELNKKLETGWNPWIESENSMAYHTFEAVCDKYKTTQIKLCSDDCKTAKTLTDYLSRLRQIEKFNQQRKIPITYIYQFNRIFINEFLDYVYIDKDNTPKTRNNYLTWLNTFGTYLVQKCYLKENPANGVAFLPHDDFNKFRDRLQKKDLEKLNAYLTETNKHYLLACRMVHYTTIRPTELSNIKLEHFNLRNMVLFIPKEISKNRKDGTVKINKQILNLMLDLGTFNSPSQYYLFGRDFTPSAKKADSRIFREYWLKVREALKFPKSYQFYSLKDTGLTAIANEKGAVVARDQARHSSIETTNLYIKGGSSVVHDELVNFDTGL